jgi:osmotically-inducible protein OsmY
MGQQDLSGRTCASNPSAGPNASQQIIEGAENCLRHNSYLALKNVHCDYHEGVLTLSGCLPTYYLKQMAQSVVGRVAGVQRIVNDIEVVAVGLR